MSVRLDVKLPSTTQGQKINVKLHVVDDSDNIIPTSNHKKQKTSHNRGTGAGGANTNKNGKAFENTCVLESEWENNSQDANGLQTIRFKESNKYLIYAPQGKFKKQMSPYLNKEIEKGHGCRHPDQPYIDEDRKIIHIIEEKFQNCGGSVCEKIQGAPFKIQNYLEQYPGWKVNYMFILSPFYQRECKAELKYLDKNSIPYFIFDNNDENNTAAKKAIVQHILNF